MKKKDKNQFRSMTALELKKEIANDLKASSVKKVGKKDTSTRNVKEGKAQRIKRAILLTLLREKELQV